MGARRRGEGAVRRGGGGGAGRGGGRGVGSIPGWIIGWAAMISVAGEAGAGELREHYDWRATAAGRDWRAGVRTESLDLTVRRIEEEHREEVVVAGTSSVAGGWLRVGTWSGRHPARGPTRTARTSPEPRLRSSVVGTRRGVSWSRAGFGGLWEPEAGGTVWWFRPEGGAVVGPNSARTWVGAGPARWEFWRDEEETGMRLRWLGRHEWIAVERVGPDWWFGSELRASARGTWRGRFELTPVGRPWQVRWRSSWVSRVANPELRVSAERGAGPVRGEVRVRVRAGGPWEAEARWNSEGRSPGPLRAEVRWRGSPIDLRATVRSLARDRALALRAIVGAGPHRAEVRWESPGGWAVRWTLTPAPRRAGAPGRPALGTSQSG